VTMRAAVQKILISYHVIPAYRAAVFREMANRLAGMRVMFVAGVTSPAPDLAVLDPVRLSRAPDICGVRLRNHWWRQWLWQSGLPRLCLGGGWDAGVFLAAPQYLSTWLGACLISFLGGRVIFWTHGIYGCDSRWRRVVKQAFYSVADKILVYGHYEAGLLREQGVSRGRLAVVYNSLDYAAQKAVRTQLESQPSLPPKAVVIAFVGRLTFRKRLDLLLQAVKVVIDHGVDCRVRLVGSGPERRALERLARELGLFDAVTFHGETRDEAVIGPIIFGADLCVVPGDAGLTVMHALAYGTPVITHSRRATQMPEVEAIVPGCTGDFFLAGDYWSLAKTILAWIGAPRDREDTRRHCVEIIERTYNPLNQADVILRSVFDEMTYCVV